MSFFKFMELLKNIYFLTVSFFFLYFNYKIILSDIKEKIIPNKFLAKLLLLIPFYYISIFFFSPTFLTWNHISFLVFIIQIFLTIIVWFWLYSFWLWGAWDAKYIVVLWLFIPQIGIIPFIWNIALLIVFYLFLYFIWFYLWKSIFKKWYAIWIYQGIKKDLSDKFKLFLKTNSTNEINKKYALLKIFRWLVLFLVIFVTIRLARLYIIDDIINSPLYNQLVSLKDNYSSYILGGLIILFLLCTICIRYLIMKWKIFILSKTNEKNIFVSEIIFLSFLSIGLVWFIFYEYSIKNAEISIYLTRIFTIYIFLYILFKILKYSYYITFQVNEQDFIIIKSLKAGDIVDKEYLIKIFWDQDCLWGNGMNGILSPNPKKYFSEIENPINEETKNKLIEIYKIVNTYHIEEKKDSKTRIINIKILKTFPLWGYIFFWFILTYFFWNSLFSLITKYFLKFIFPS